MLCILLILSKTSIRIRINMSSMSDIINESDPLLPNESRKREKNQKFDWMTIISKLGVEEVYNASFYKCLVAEFSATTVLVYAHIMIVVSALKSDYPAIYVAIFHGLIISIFILQFCNMSGYIISLICSIIMNDRGSL